jgi:hypothetical protein
MPILPRAALIACWLAMVKERNAQREGKRERVWRRIMSEIFEQILK